MKFLQKEVCEIWEPLLGIPKKLYLRELKDTPEGFDIKLTGPDKISIELGIHFEYLMFYMNLDESNCSKLFKSRVWDPDRSLFIVRGSRLVQWFHWFSGGIRLDHQLTHYSIMTRDDIVEIISEVEPKVTLLDRSSVP